MRFWFDTEFYEDGRTIELISIGIVAEDGRRYYAETMRSRSLAQKTPWLKTNVYPHLTGARRGEESLKMDLVEFFGGEPEIWAYYGAYDWVVLCQLFGRMIDLPAGWPMWCRDVKQLAWMIGDPKLPTQNGKEHHALADAVWTKEAWDFLISLGAWKPNPW